MYKFYLYHPDLQKPTLIKTPVGWDSNTKTRNRDLNYHGVFINFTEQLQFIKDGKQIIHKLYEQYGIEAVIILTIFKLNKVSHKFELDYKGRLNLSTFKVNQTVATCNVENTGFLQQFYNQQQIKYAVSDSGVQTINLPSISLQKKLVGSHKNDDAAYEDLDYVGSDTPNYIIITPTLVDVDEITDRFDYPVQVSTTDPVVSRLYFIKITEKANVSLSGHIYVKSEPQTTSDHTLKWFVKYGSVSGGFTTIQLGATVVNTGISFVTADFDYSGVTFSVNKNDEIYFYGVHTYPSAFGSSIGFIRTKDDITPFHYLSIQIVADTLDADSDSEIIPVFEFLDNLIGKMTGQPNRLKSNFYGRTENGYSEDGAGSLRGITNGGLIKQQDITLKPIYAQFDQVFKSLKAIDNIGVGYQIINGVEYILIEPAEFFYQRTELFKLENVLDIEKSPIAGDYHNAAEFGYSKSDYSKLSSLDEFNTKRQFSTPITQVQSTLSYMSDLIASGYTIELVRRDRINTGTTKDQQADTDNFIIQLRRDGSDLIVDRDEDFTSITNLTAGGTMYNLKLSPERMVKTHGSELRSFLEKQKDQTVIQTSSVGNSQMTTQLATETTPVVENANILISDLARPVYLAEQYKFPVKLTAEQLAAMDANPYGYISFRKSVSNPYSHMYIMIAQAKGSDGSIDFVGRRANI